MRGFILTKQLRHFLADENGATAIEYAVIASGVSIAILGAVSTLGTQIKDVFYTKIGSLF